MSALQDLYQDLILDHNAEPRNYGCLKDATHRAVGTNPLCGDTLTLDLTVQGNRIQAARFVGAGCAISRASASLMTVALEGLTLRAAQDLLTAFLEFVAGTSPGHQPTVTLGKLDAFAGVRAFPSRVKCATLAWHTLRAALEERGGSVSTE